MNSIRRAWGVSDILGLFPDVQEADSFVIRCKRTVVGEGQYVKDENGVLHTVVIVVQVTPDERLSVSVGHEWPVGVSGARVNELDQAVLRGIAGGLARRCGLAAWGCGVTTISAIYVDGTEPTAVQIAASLALQDALQKAEWSSPEPPSEPEAA